MVRNYVVRSPFWVLGWVCVGLTTASGVLADGTHAVQQVALADHDHHHHQVPLTGYKRSVEDYAIPDVALIGSDGVRVPALEELGGDGPVLMNFIFTTCTAICPVMSATFSQVQDVLGREQEKVTMVSVSIDPEQDTPERLAAYAERFDASPNWHFFTGTVADSVKVQMAFDVYRGGKMNHVPVTLIRPKPEAPWVRLEGLASADDIVREYHGLVR